MLTVVTVRVQLAQHEISLPVTLFSSLDLRQSAGKNGSESGYSIWLCSSILCKSNGTNRKAGNSYEPSDMQACIISTGTFMSWKSRCVVDSELLLAGF